MMLGWSEDGPAGAQRVARAAGRSSNDHPVAAIFGDQRAVHTQGDVDGPCHVATADHDVVQTEYLEALASRNLGAAVDHQSLFGAPVAGDDVVELVQEVVDIELCQKP